MKDSTIHLLRRFAFGTVVVSLVFGLIPKAQAISLTSARAYMNRQKEGLTTGQQFELFFTPTFNLSLDSGTLRLLFPDGDDGQWCRSAGTVTPTGITNPTGGSESATAITAFGSASCTIGSGPGSADANRDQLILVVGQAISSGTKYGVRLVGNSAVLGTAAAANSIKVEMRWSDNDSMSVNSTVIALSLLSEDQINVTANIEQTLSVTLSGNSVGLGTLSSTQVNQGSITSTVSTSAANGYISVISYDHTLTVGALTVDDTAGGTIVAGEEEYGVSTSQAGNTIAQWSPTSCTTTASTSSATALSTTFKTFASSAVAATNETTTICFLASISPLTSPGTYTSTATLVTTARF